MGSRAARNRGRHKQPGRELVKAAVGGPRPTGASAVEISRDGSRSTSARTVQLAEAVQAMTAAVTQGGRPAEPVVNMPRDPLDTSPFGPLWPLYVQAINPPRPDTGQPEPRAWDYPQGFNLPGGGEKLIPWKTLRDASNNVDVIRRCIEIRKDDVRALKPTWTISEDAVKAAIEDSGGKASREDVEAELRRKFAPDIARLTRFWARPWITNGVRFGQWVAAVMEDHIVCDGVAIYPVTTVGGQVIAFRVVDATTIKLLINADGERPRDPFPAFQQIVAGFPRGEYHADIVLREDGTEDTSTKYTASQLTYWRENLRTNSPYGQSQVEMALVSAALYLKRQGWMHDTYDEGATPDTWLVPEGEKFVASQMDPTKRREYEQAINDDLAGQSGRRRHIKVSYPGFRPEQMKTEAEQYKPEYDRFLVNMLIGHLGVTMDRFGLTETKGLGATGQHERQAEVQDDSGVNPDAEMICDLIQDLSRNYLDAPEELCFTLVKRKADDKQAEDQVADTQIKRGSMTLNEDRRRLGRTTYDFPEADMPAFYGATGPMYLEGGLERQQMAQEQQAALVDARTAPPAPGGSAGGGGAGGADDLKPTAGRPTMGKPRITKAAAAGEIVAYHRWVRKQAGKGVPARPFRFEHADPFDFPPEMHDGRWMAFEGWQWVADPIEKRAGSRMGDWRAWNAAHPLHPRGPHGRFVKVGNLVDELKRIHGPLDEHHENAFDEAVRRAHAGRPLKRGESALADELERRGLLEEHGGRGANKDRLELSEAGRRHQQARPVAEPKPAAPAASKPEAPKIEDARGQSAADRLRQAEVMYGSDRSKWPAHAKRDAAKLEQRAQAEKPSTSNGLPTDSSGTIAGMTSDEELYAKAREELDKVPGLREQIAGQQRPASGELQRPSNAGDVPVARRATEPGETFVGAPAEAESRRRAAVDRNAVEHGYEPIYGEAPSAPEQHPNLKEDAKRAEEARAAQLRSDEERRKAMRAELISRTGEAYGLLLDAGARKIEHKPSRKVVEAMRADGWKLTEMQGPAMLWEAPDGRKIRMVLGKDKPYFEGGDRASLTYPKALEHVRPAGDKPEAGPAAPKRLPDAQHNALMTIAQARAEHAQREDANSTVAPTERQMGLTRYTTTSALQRSGHIERYDVGAGTAARLTPEGHAYLAEHTGDTERAALVRELADVRAQRAALAADSASRPVERHGAYDTHAARIRQMNNEQDKPLYAREHQILRDLEARPVQGAAEPEAMPDAVPDVPAPSEAPGLTREVREAKRVIEGHPSSSVTTYSLNMSAETWRTQFTPEERAAALERLQGIRARMGDDARDAAMVDANIKALRNIDHPEAVQAEEAARTAERVASGEIKRAIPKREGPAKRGDVIVVEKREREATRDGKGRERTTYEVYEITGVTRDGQPKAVRELVRGDKGDKGMDVKHMLDRRHGKRQVIPGDQIDADALTAALKSHTYSGSTRPRDHESLAELSDVLRGALRPEGWTPPARRSTAPSGPVAAVDTTRVHLPEGLTDEQRAKFGPNAEKIDAANAKIIAEPYDGPAKLGDEAVQSVKAARELVAQARDAGMVVGVLHRRTGDGDPLFTIQAVHPDTGEAFEATWHTAKGKNGSYGFMHGSIVGGGQRRREAGPKAISEHMGRAGERQAARDAEEAARAERARIAADPRTPKRMAAAEVQQGDWRWNPVEGWQRIGMIDDRGDGSRVLYGEDRETRLGTLSTGGSLSGDNRHWIVRNDERPTEPPPGEKMPAAPKADASQGGTAQPSTAAVPHAAFPELRQDMSGVRPEVYSGAEMPVKPVGPPSEQQVRDAIRSIQVDQGAPVYLSYLRERIGGTQAEQDDLFRRMAADRSARFFPEEAQMALEQPDRAAAIDFGGEPKHKISLAGGITKAASSDPKA